MAGADGIDSTGTYIAGSSNDANADSAVYNTVTGQTTVVALGSNSDSQAWAVNRYGVVVGSTPVGGDGTAFIYANGTTYDNFGTLIVSGATAGTRSVGGVHQQRRANRCPGDRQWRLR